MLRVLIVTIAFLMLLPAGQAPASDSPLPVNETKLWPPVYDAEALIPDEDYLYVIDDITASGQAFSSRITGMTLDDGTTALMIGTQALLFVAPDGTVSKADDFIPGVIDYFPYAYDSHWGLWCRYPDGSVALFSPQLGCIDSYLSHSESGYGKAVAIGRLRYSEAVVTDENWIFCHNMIHGESWSGQLPFDDEIRSIHWNDSHFLQDSIFLLGNTTLFCIDLRTLELKWSIDFKSSGILDGATNINDLLGGDSYEGQMDVIRGGPFLNQDIVFRRGKLHLTTYFQHLFVVSDAGELIKTVNFNDYINDGSLVYYGDNIAVKTLCGLTVALDKDYRVSWYHKGPKLGPCKPVVIGDYLAVTDIASNILLLDNQGEVCRCLQGPERKFVPVMFRNGDFLYYVVKTKDRVTRLGRIDLNQLPGFSSGE